MNFVNIKKHLLKSTWNDTEPRIAKIILKRNFEMERKIFPMPRFMMQLQQSRQYNIGKRTGIWINGTKQIAQEQNYANMHKWSLTKIQRQFVVKYLNLFLKVDH